MGMFDSLFVKCPTCGKELEFQSKSGACALNRYTRKNLPISVAVGIDGDIIKCEFCSDKFQIKCKIPLVASFKLIKTGKRAVYSGNYNPDLPANKRKIQALKKGWNIGK